MLCRTKAEPTQWWIQIPKSDPPDVLAMNLISTENGNGNYMSILPVEVFEISENNCETIEKSIERKLVGDNGLKIKDYSKTMVVGFVRRKQIFNHEIVSDYIKNLNHKASAVYLIVNEENSTNFSFIGIFPDCFKYNCDWGAMCKNINQNDYIEMERASKTKPHVTKYTNDILTLVPE